MSVPRCTGGRGERWVLAGVTGALALMAAPAAASACPAFAKEKAFHGTASASFKQTASHTDQNGTTTVTLDRVADGLQFPKLVPVSFGHGLVTFTGPPKGGSVGVNDVYSGSNGVSGAQTASGPTLGFPAAGKAGVSFYPAQFGCRYGVIFSFAIRSTPSGDWPSPPDRGAYGVIATPERAIPANLKLSGTATVGWEADPNAGKGYYRASGIGVSDTWATELESVLQESGMAPGTARISWSFSPGLAAPTTYHLLIFISASFIRAGRTTLVHFRITWNRQPAPGALIEVAGQTTGTGKNGRASLKLHPTHPGRLLVIVRYRRHRSTSVITVR